MAVKPKTYNYTFASTAAVPLSTIINRSGNTWMGSLAVRAGRANLGDVFWRDVAGTDGGFIGPSEATTFDFGEGQALVRGLSFRGLAGDSIYLTVMFNAVYFDDAGEV